MLLIGDFARARREYVRAQIWVEDEGWFNDGERIPSRDLLIYVGVVNGDTLTYFLHCSSGKIIVCDIFDVTKVW